MKELTGKVISNKALKTVTVVLNYTTLHPMYKKILRRTTKVLAHCEIDGVAQNDLVTIRQSRPISKNKHFTVTGLVGKKGKEVGAKPVEMKMAAARETRARSVSKRVKK